MSNTDRSNKGTRIGGSITAPICTDSECSASICIEATDENETADPLPIPQQSEISSTTGNSEDFYKMKSDVQCDQFVPGKIEFRRIKTKSQKYICKTKTLKKNAKQVSDENRALVESPKKLAPENNDSFFNRLQRSFAKMKQRKLFLDNHTEMRSPRKRDPEKIDVYYFDHGNAAYFRTTDSPPTIFSEMLAQQTTYYATRFWAEIFGSLHIGVTFFITFFLQTYRFILCSILRAVIVGVFQMTSDYLFKPILTVVFNGLFQPILILFYNVFSSVKDMLEPIAETIGDFLKPITGLLKSVRLVTISKKTIVYNNQKEDEASGNVEEV